MLTTHLKSSIESFPVYFSSEHWTLAYSVVFFEQLGHVGGKTNAQAGLRSLLDGVCHKCFACQSFTWQCEPVGPWPKAFTVLFA